MVTNNFMKLNNNYIYLGLLVFVLYFNEILIINEKFLIFLIFITFILFLRNKFKNEILSFFINKNKELIKEIFLLEFITDAKYKYIYLYITLDLARKQLFSKIYNIYLQSLNFVIIFYYNYIYRKKYSLVLNNFRFIINDVYFFILKKHLFIKLNFLYRSYYYIFNKFKI